MIRFIFFCLGKIFIYRRAVLMAFAWIARFGYLAYVLYGLVEWFRPGRMADTLYRRRTLLYCLFSVGLGSALSFVIGRIWVPVPLSAIEGYPLSFLIRRTRPFRAITP